MDPDRLRLLQRKLGSLLDWTVPAIRETVGPCDPSVFDQFDAQRRAAIAQCEARLLEYTDDQIAALTGTPDAGSEGLRKEWRAFEGEAIDRLQRKTPPWYAGGFGHPDHAADFQYWCKMPSFSVDEILCLSVGVDPKQFHPEKLGRVDEDAFRKLWPSLQFFMRRRELFLRQFDPNSLGDRVRPQRFLDWVDQVDLDVDPEFLQLLRQYHRSQNSGVSRTAAPPDKREVNSIAQLFTAMAIELYGYRPGDSRSPVTTDIANLAAQLGISITDDTIRKYLKIGGSAIPKDWEPN